MTSTTPEMKELRTDWREKFDELFVTTIRGGLMSYDDTWQGDVKTLVKLFIQQEIDASYKRGKMEVLEEVEKELTFLYEEKCKHFKRSPLTTDLETSNFNNLLSGIILSQKVTSKLKQLNQTHREA